MHREISHTDEVFAPRSNVSLYLMTGLMAALLALDLWPWIAAALGPSLGVTLPSWPRDILGWRIALIAAILGGARTLYGSLEGLFEGKVGADLAIAIAAIAAILIGEPLVAAEVVFIGMVGEVLESLTFERTQRAIRKLVEVFPRRCWRLENGQEVRVRTNELKPGDRIVVKPGARIPADGVVIEGRSSLDVSALTGESLPQDKGPGDEVLAGALNQTGALVMEAKRVSEQTVMGRVIELTSKALKDKLPIERTADRLARYFLPFVLALATLTFLVSLGFYLLPWYRAAGSPPMTFWAAARLSVYPTLSVLVVACPCALILATPAAVIAALGRLAGTGVLIKGGRALEQLATVKAFAFDKTGTLTEGRLELGDVIGLDGVAADEVLSVAAAAEQRSEHLLARLITQEAARRQLPLDTVDEFQAHPGGGVTVRTPAGPVVVGTRRLLEEQGVAVPDQAQALLDQLNASGQTALLVARDGVVLGAIGARDRVRPEAAGVLEELRSLGISEIALLTGDRRAVAEAVARELGITEVHAELLPQDKANLIAGEGRPPTAFVGDGINDAPALARATVGLAVGTTGTDVAAEAGDVVFMGDPLKHIPLLLRLSRETVKVIRQNILIFAFGVNAAGILLTAWLWPVLFPKWYEQSPLAAVIYHQLGSLAVLLNAMRLLWFERGDSKTMVSLRATARKVDAWMERYLNVDEGVHWLSHHWKPVLLSGGVLLLALYFLSGFIAIGPDEVGIVRQFGRALDEDLTPGLHYRWPWPVETVTRIQPGRVRTVEVGYRTVPGSTPASLAWSSPHGGDGLRRVPEEALMITGDGNLVEIQATIRYTVVEPHVYLFEAADPEEVLRGLTESVLRQTVAASPFLDLLTVRRQDFQDRVLATVSHRLDEWQQQTGNAGLGIRLEGFSVQDLHPPQEVVEDYYKVTMAMEARDREVNRAQAEALYKDREAKAKAQQIRNSARAAKAEVVREAEAAQAVFLARQRARSRLPLLAELQIADEVTGGADAGQKLRAAGELAVWALTGRPPPLLGPWAEKRRRELETQALLTDFRLFWDAMGRSLAGREKLIVDSDQVRGKRQLWLFDPEMFRLPVPLLAPTERNQPPRGELHERGP